MSAEPTDRPLPEQALPEQAPPGQTLQVRPAERLAVGDHLVEGGEATLFLAHDLGPDGPGRRTAVVTLHGPAVLPLGAVPDGICYILAPGPATRATALDTATGGPITDEALMATAAALCRTLAPETPPLHVLRLGTRRVALEAGASAVVDTPCWVTAEQGVATAHGTELPDGGLWLTPDVPLEGLPSCTLTTRPLAEVGTADRLAALRWLCVEAVGAAHVRHTAQLERETAAITAAPGAAAAAERRAVHLLLADGAGATVVPGDGADPLVACAVLAGRTGGFVVKAPTGGLQGREGTDAVRAVALASGLYARRVTLPDRWWTAAVEPMVGFQPDGTPVALIPDGARWVIADADGGRWDADGANHPHLLGTAFVFTAPPPAQPVGAGGLLRWAFDRQFGLLGKVALWATVLAAVSCTVPLASGVVFGEIIPQGDRTRLAWLSAALVLAAVAVLPLQVVLTRVQSHLESTVSLRLQRGAWARVLRSPVALVRRLGAGDIAGRLAAVEVARDQIGSGVLGALPAVIAASMAAVLMVVQQPVLAVIAMAWGLVVLAVTVVVARRVARAQRTTDVANGEMTGFLYQVLTATSSLQIAGAEARAFAAWATRFRQAIGRELSRRMSTQMLLTGLVATANTLVLFLGVLWSSAASDDVGAFISFQLTYNLFMGGLLAAAGAVGIGLQMQPALDRVAELVSEPPETMGQGRDPGTLRGAVSLRNVVFRYDADGPVVLDGIDLDIAPGEMVALVGRSGCGKSTVLRLLLGFEQPQEGSVSFDDHALASLDKAALRRQLGVVMQNGGLTPGTIHQNIAGATALSTAEVWELAEIVAMAEDIKAMPMQLETLVTLNGGAFSGGQRQRLLIARALATKPKILMLDEATSALDNVTQAVITHNLADLGITRIVVAHRLSTIAGADRVVVLDGGRIAEQGTYPQLMGRAGLFHTLASRQLL